MMVQALAALLGLGSLGLIGWGLVEGPGLLIIVGIVLFFASGILYNVAESGLALARIRKRHRPWGQPLPADEKRLYGSRLVFEPTCLKSGCGGPVVELIRGRLPAHPGAFLGKFDPALPDYYVQGSAQCARCKQRYLYTIVHGGLHLRTPEGETRLDWSFNPL